MIDQKDSELVQAGIDGELDAEGQRRLEALLAASPEARDLHEDPHELVNLAMDRSRRPELRRRFRELRALEDATYGADWVERGMAAPTAAVDPQL